MPLLESLRGSELGLIGVEAAGFVFLAGAYVTGLLEMMEATILFVAGLLVTQSYEALLQTRENIDD